MFLKNFQFLMRQLKVVKIPRPIKEKNQIMFVHQSDFSRREFAELKLQFYSR